MPTKTIPADMIHTLGVVRTRVQDLVYNADIVAGCIADRFAVDGMDDFDRRYWAAAYVKATTDLRDTRALRDDLMAVTA